jgi:serine/alanine adding enzyme
VSLVIRPFDGREAEWDAVAREHPGFTHFHRFGWKEVMAGVFGHECLYLGARDAAGTLVAVLPLVRVKSILFGHYLVSMPFLNYGGPLGSAEGVAALAQAAQAEARSSGAKLLELRSRVELALPLPVSHRKITVLLDLPETADALMKSFGSKLRSQVRRPQKEGVTVRFGPDQVEPFFRVFSRHMRDLGTPTLPLAWFAAIARRFPEDAWFACAWLGDEPVAGGAGFRWADELEMTWASSLSAHNRIAPNMLLYWAFMERAQNEGIRRFNFGRCTPGSGTHRFKSQWGGHDQPLYWYQASRAAGEPAATPSPDQGAYAWGPRVWKHLPLPLATALGPRIVRWIP